MTNTIWKTGIDGDWTTGADWTGGRPTASKDAIINADGTYTVTVSSADVAHSLTLDQAGATLSEDSGGSLTMAGALTLDAGTVILDGANSFGGGTTLFGGTLELGNATALGTSGLTINGGALVAAAAMTFSNTLAASGSFTLAAGDGDFVKLASQTNLNMNSGGTIQFGQAGDDGVFVWDPVTLGVVGTGFSVDVSAGTLRDGNGSLNELLSTAAVNIDAGATIDTHGHSETFGNLSGAGDVTISKTLSGTLTVGGGNFSGSISGDFGLAVTGDLSLTGVNTYTGETTVAGGVTLDLGGVSSLKDGTTLGDGTELDFASSGSITGGIAFGNNATLDFSANGSIKGGASLGDGATFDFSGDGSIAGGVTFGNNAVLNFSSDGAITGGLMIGNDSTSDFSGNGSIAGGITIGADTTFLWDSGGSIAGSIVDNGTVDIQRSDSATFALPTGISGTGSLKIEKGVFTLTGTNTYSGGTTVFDSTLSISHAAALGTGALILSSDLFGSSTLIATATESLSNQLEFTTTRAALLADHGKTLTLNTGAAWTIDHSSVIFGDTTHDGTIVWDTPAGSVNNVSSIEIAGGTLRAGDSNFQTLFAPVQPGGITVIDPGATLDVAGFATTIYNLGSHGTIESTGAAATVTLSGMSYSDGTVGAHVTFDIDGEANLVDAAANCKIINVLTDSQLTLASPSSSKLTLSSDDFVTLGDPGHFTGHIGGLQQGDVLRFDGIARLNAALSYSGNTSGGVLTIANANEGVSFSVNLVGNYTAGEFSISGGHNQGTEVTFTPTPMASAATTHADTFDFSTTPTAAPETGVTHLQSGHSANEFAFAHDVTEVLHAYDLMLDHFAHGLFAHGQAFAEALA